MLARINDAIITDQPEGDGFQEDRVGNVPPPINRRCATDPLHSLHSLAGLSFLLMAFAPRPRAPVAPSKKRRVSPLTVGVFMSSSENRKRVVNLKVRCLPDEADVIRDKALDSGCSVSEFMRCAALGRKTRSTTSSSRGPRKASSWSA